MNNLDAAIINYALEHADTEPEFLKKVAEITHEYNSIRLKEVMAKTEELKNKYKDC